MSIGGASRGQPRPGCYPTRHQDMDSPRFEATAGAPPNTSKTTKRRRVASAPSRRPPRLSSRPQKCQSRVGLHPGEMLLEHLTDAADVAAGPDAGDQEIDAGGKVP